jgi:hypothetical protein
MRSLSKLYTKFMQTLCKDEMVLSPKNKISKEGKITYLVSACLAVEAEAAERS